jgi:hypothetical protein
MMPKRLSATQALEVETLCSALFDGSITPDQFRLLQVYLRISASSRQLFIQHRNLHGALAAACAYEVLPTHSFTGMQSRDVRLRGVQGKVEKRSLASASTMPASLSKSKFLAPATSKDPDACSDSRRVVIAPWDAATEHVTATSLSIASLVTVLVLVVMAVFTPPGRRLIDRFTISTSATTGPIARLTKVRNCAWQDPATAPRIGTELAAGQKLNLAKGLAEIKYNNGVQVILEGPAVFEISRPGQSYLTSGKMTATVPSHAIGYTVETPNARVIDMGTEFAVKVRPGKLSEVHVFQGRVEAQWLGKAGPMGETVNLSAGKAARFEFNTEREPIPTFAANEAGFERALDRSARIAAKKTWWRESMKRLRADQDLVIYYSFAGTGSNQREFTNQAFAANEQFPCLLKGVGKQERGLSLVRGKWPWSAALEFGNDTGGYLLVEGLANEGLAGARPAGIPLGHAMSLVTTVGSLVTTVGSLVTTVESRMPPADAVADGEDATGDSITIMRGPILMSRGSHAGNTNFQLSVFSSTQRGQSGRVEFRLNRNAKINPRVASSDQSAIDLADIVLSGEVDLDGSRWHQFVVVCDLLAVRLYCDGNQMGEQPLDEPLALQLDEFSIGRGLYASPEGKTGELGFVGLMDDLAIFKRPLEESEIRSMAELY